MKNSPDELLSYFHDKLTSDRRNKTNVFESEIKNSYFEILSLLTKNYHTHSKYIPKFLGSLEQNDAVACSLSVFFDLYDTAISLSITSENISTIDLSALHTETSSEHISRLQDKLIKLIEDNIGYENNYRISEHNLDLEALENDEIKMLVTNLVNSLQYDSKTIEWSDELLQDHMWQLIVLKALLHSLGSSSIFYLVASLFLDRLNYAEYFQKARDLSEEIIISAFKDRIPEFGFLNSYQCYSRQKNIHSAILYANLSLYTIIYYEKQIFDKYLQKFIWETIKCFRDSKLHSFVVKIYENIPYTIQFSGYERRGIDHSYYLTLLLMKNEKLPDKILHYLNKERENILKSNGNEAMPWLILLHNIKRIYPESNFSSTGLGYYLKIFEHIVPKESIEKHINLIYGTSQDIKAYLQSSLIKLNQTRSKIDIVYDIKHAVTIANRLIEKSFEIQNVEAILLAMLIKSDFSLIFKSTETNAFEPFEFPDSDLRNFYSIYDSHEAIIEKLHSIEGILIVWLPVVEGEVFQLSFLNNDFSFSECLFSFSDGLYKLKQSNYFSQLNFQDTIKDGFGVRDVLEEEHLSQQEKIKRDIDFARLCFPEIFDEIFVIKDMELANFPHNLFLDEHGDFIHARKPIANILSLEWYLKCRNDSRISEDLTKSIWIPTESGDLTLNMLYNSLESELTASQFEIYNEKSLRSPLSSDLNIVCSHGANDIALRQVIYPGDHPLDNIEKIIGSGIILIFFVCHSGSYTKEYFRCNVSSLVKTYINLGYKAVIAPFWSLHINIPNIWLSNFISIFSEGHTINYSVFTANRSVSTKYQTPAAWACMHLYGNPHLTNNSNLQQHFLCNQLN